MKTNSKASLPACRKGKIALSEPPLTEFDTKLELIQMLIPIALERVQEVLQQEVAELAGPAPPPNKHMDAGRSPRYVHNDSRRDHKRWGRQRGSVHLGDQKVPILVPRVRHHRQNREIPLVSYHRLQKPRLWRGQ